MSSCSQALEKPPTRGNMGVIQIIELVIMGVVAVLCVVDFINILGYGIYWYTIFSLAVDVLIVVGLVFIILGLFVGLGSQRRIRIGLYCFFAGCIIEIIVIVFWLISGAGTLGYWILNLFMAILLIFLAYVLWKQSSHL